MNRHLGNHLFIPQTKSDCFLLFCRFLGDTETLYLYLQWAKKKDDKVKIQTHILMYVTCISNSIIWQHLEK